MHVFAKRGLLFGARPPPTRVNSKQANKQFSQRLCSVRLCLVLYGTRER